MTVKHVCIVGVGLIGGSLAAAWRQAQYASHISGLETDPDAAQQALQMGLVDELVAAVPADVDLIAVCTPSDKIANQVAALANHGAVMFDVGSVKAPIIATLQAGQGVPGHYVASHPISGSEQSGPKAADATLFQHTTTVVTPTDTTTPAALETVRLAWQAAGAEVVVLGAEDHDEMLAVTSHLPHLLAFVYMQQVAAEQLSFTGGGFRDFTRIAAANPKLWWRILSMNKDQVLDAADEFRRNLDQFTDALASEAVEDGIAALQTAAELRKTLES